MVTKKLSAADKWVIGRMVGNLHVSASAAEVESHIRARLAKGASEQMIKQVLAVALKEHQKNIDLYKDVMGGRVGRRKVKRNPGVMDALTSPLAMGALDALEYHDTVKKSDKRGIRRNPEGGCQMCGGPLGYMGALGAMMYYRCQDCCWEQGERSESSTPMKKASKKRSCKQRKIKKNPSDFGLNPPRGKMTKAQVEKMFRAEILPEVKKQYERDGRRDGPARSEAFNALLDGLARDGMITWHQVNTWTNPF